MKQIEIVGKVLNCIKKQSKLGKEYFKAEYNNKDIGVVSEFIPLELVPAIQVDKEQTFIYEVKKDGFNSLRIALQSIK